jgi:hypothetical protein
MADLCRIIEVKQYRLLAWIRMGLLPAPTHQIGHYVKKMYSAVEVEIIRQAVPSITRSIKQKEPVA